VNGGRRLSLGIIRDFGFKGGGEGWRADDGWLLVFCLAATAIMTT
jgi:hypothetical protein